MLVHKATLGVLQWYWDGESYLIFDGVQRPKMELVTFETHDLDPEEWWQIPNGTYLSKKIAWSYPFFEPKIVDGLLVDVEPWPSWKVYGEPPPEEVVQIEPPKPNRKKYNRRRSLL